MSIEGQQAVVVPTEDGIERGFVSDLYRVKLTAGQTGGSFGLVHAYVPPGGGPPPHIHYRSDEIFYILDGAVEMLDGDQIFLVSAGDTVFFGRGGIHRFLNVVTRPATLLFMFTPGGVEGSFVEAGDEVKPGVPVAPWTPDRVNEHLMKTMNRHDTFLPPATGTPS